MLLKTSSLPSAILFLQGHVDFKTEPWPKLSEAAKDCVKRLLEQVRVCVCVCIVWACMEGGSGVGRDTG